MSAEKVAAARRALALARAYTPHDDFDRRRVADNITQIEAHIARLTRTDHPSGGGDAA